MWYGSTSLFFYIKNPDQYSVFLPATVAGIKKIYPTESKNLHYKRPFHKNYPLFNKLCEELKTEYSLKPQELDIILAIFGKEEIMYNWIKHIRQIMSNYFTMDGRIYDEEKILQEEFDEKLLQHIRNYLRNLKQLLLWVNRQQSHIFSAKQPYDYWFNVFKTGEAPDGTKLLSQGINLMEMIKP